MASIHKRGRKYYVVIYVVNQETLINEPKWIKFDTEEEAEAYKGLYEAQQENDLASKANKNKVATNATRTVEQLAWRYVKLVGKTKWGLKTYPTYISRLNNYILPHIGSWRVWECTVEKMDEYFAELREMQAVKPHGWKTEKKISTRTLEEVHKFIKAMFNQAIEWGYMKQNPCKKKNSTLPKHIYAEREAWTKEDFKKALQCAEYEQDGILIASLLLGVSTAMREGEIAGLRWKNCHISDDDIRKGTCRILVDCTLSRVSKEMIKLKPEDILYTFPNTFSGSKSSLVLKIPKTVKSKRLIYLPRFVARHLNKVKQYQKEAKRLLGNEYNDHDLVVSLPDGRPIENKLINNRLRKLIDKYGLPFVVFHSLRHTSSTYKLRVSGGDVKNVMLETGHASPDVLLQTYSKAFTEDRQEYAQLLDNVFFSDEEDESVNAVLEAANQYGEAQLSNQEMASIIAILSKNPQMKNQILASV